MDDSLSVSETFLERVRASIYVGDLVEKIEEKKKSLGVRGGIGRADYTALGLAVRRLRVLVESGHPSIVREYDVVRDIFERYERSQLEGDLAGLEAVERSL